VLLARAEARFCPNSRATISRFSRPVMVGSTAANCPAQPDRRLHDVRLPDHVVPEDAQGAGVGFEQGGDAAHEGGLAGAVGPEHGQDRTLFREQLQPVERGRVPESLNHTGGFDHVRHWVLLRHWLPFVCHRDDQPRPKDVTPAPPVRLLGGDHVSQRSSGP
jgi:hypothetical protein